MIARFIRCFGIGLSALIVGTSQFSTSYAAELVMFESDTCEWCEAWHAQIGPIYPKTSEGQKAPLRTVDIHDPRPSDLVHIEGVRFTPTFVLLNDDGKETGRINGYPGEAFFWGLLEELVMELSTGQDVPNDT